MHHTRDDETIIAQCTPRGSGAIALLRLSGKDAIAVAGSMSTLPSGKLLIEQPTHTIHYGWVVDECGVHVDQVMFLLMRAPSTFTGQDTVEITCHNNQFLVEALIENALKKGARLAQEGEFSRRAYLNGKIDLIQAEAIDDLIHANTQFTLKKSLAQVEGSFSQWIYRLEQQLIKALAWCEASFEFLDEGGDFIGEIKDQLQAIITQVGVLQQSFGLQKHIREGIRIACIGSVNVGKSSLFNALLSKNRAIVSDVAGTTRDSIEAGVYRKGLYWTFIDTAGLRQTADTIEKAGIERSKLEAQQADIIILALDGSRPLSVEEKKVYEEFLASYRKKIILVATKADLPQIDGDAYGSTISLSVIDGRGIEQLQQVIDQRVAHIFQSHESPFLVNKRQHQLLQRLSINLESILAMCEQMNIQYELIAHNIRDALEQLSELTGKSVSEAALDAVFKEFCVGK